MALRLAQPDRPGPRPRGAIVSVRLSLDNLREAWVVLSPNFWNSVRLVVPAAILSSIVGSLNGFVLAKWKLPGADVIYPCCCLGCSSLIRPS